MQHWVIVDVPFGLRVTIHMTTIDTTSTTHPAADASHIHHWPMLDGGEEDVVRIVVAVTHKRLQKIVIRLDVWLFRWLQLSLDLYSQRIHAWIWLWICFESDMIAIFFFIYFWRENNQFPLNSSSPNLSTNLFDKPVITL